MQGHPMTAPTLATDRIVFHRTVFAFITELSGRQGMGWGNAQRSAVTFSCLAKECKPTYMPCLSTCRSHSEPSVNDRPQNSHGKRFSGAPLSGNIMGSGKGSIACEFRSAGAGRDHCNSILIPSAAPSHP